MSFVAGEKRKKRFKKSSISFSFSSSDISIMGMIYEPMASSQAVVVRLSRVRRVFDSKNFDGREGVASLRE